MLNTRYQDETRNLREKLASKQGLVQALKQFELSVRQSMFRDAGVVPSTQDMIHALKTMPPQEAQFIVTSAAVKLCPPEEEVFDYMKCKAFSEQDLTRKIKVKSKIPKQFFTSKFDSDFSNSIWLTQPNVPVFQLQVCMFPRWRELSRSWIYSSNQMSWPHSTGTWTTNNKKN